MDGTVTTAETADAELIAAYLDGDERAFEVLYCRYKRQLYGFLTNLIRNPAEVDEVFEETWVRVIGKLPKYRDDGRFSAWLFRIGRNLFFDRMRRSRVMNGALSIDSEEAAELPGSGVDRPDRMAGAEELGCAIRKAVASLPVEQREVFLLRQQELSFKEIANIQQCPLNTALGRMQYALKNLRRFLEDLNIGGFHLEESER